MVLPAKVKSVLTFPLWRDGATKAVLGVAVAACAAVAFACAIASLLLPELTSSLLAASGGFGALAFGTATLRAQAIDRLSASTRVEAHSRISRRMLVERVNSLEGQALPRWVAAVGAASALDPLERSLQSLVDVAAPLADFRSRAALNAMMAFYRGADQVNGLFVAGPEVTAFGARDVVSKGRALCCWIECIDTLDVLAFPGDADTAVSAKVREYAMYTAAQWTELADRTAAT